MLYQLGKHRPQLRGKGHFVAPTAALIGQIILEERASVWFNVTARGDAETIFIGPESNVQDGSTLHADPGFPLRIGRGVTIGHNAMVHGCEIGDYSLVGIQATVLNGARIGRHSLIGAGCLIPEGMEVPEGSMVLGVPGKVRRMLNDEERQALELSASHYIENARHFCQQLSPIGEA